MLQTLHIKKSFELESGENLSEVTIGYHTYGTLNASKSNVVWVCHALTANADATDWWKGVVGENSAIDPDKYFIVCANILGSCYGSTGPQSINPLTGESYFSDFPLITIRDMVKAHILLREHLGISSIHLLMGGSMGGYQVLEWSIMEQQVVKNIFLITTSPAESAWGIAIHTAQRLAIEADDSWKDKRIGAGEKGLKAARAIGMLTYRNYDMMVQQQADHDHEKLDNFKASSYINYQGDKLVKRFSAQSYWALTKSMDSHNISRGRGGNIAAVLRHIPQRTLVMAITSDILCPPKEQQFIAEHLPNATYIEIDSSYGHDGFLVEFQIISEALRNWLGQGAE
jgi:homoserine O-acetyltransferase